MAIECADDRPVIAPCGLDCSKCIAFEGGPVQRAAKRLSDLLGPSFGRYAERFAALDPAFGNYPAFREMLSVFERGGCGGCLSQGCPLFASCAVRPCAKEKGVAYCFQCGEFPCDHTGFPEALLVRWRRNNERMREIGPDAYAERAREEHRYP